MENSLSSQKIIIKGLENEIKRLKDELEQARNSLATKDKQLSNQYNINTSLENRKKMQKNIITSLEEKVRNLQAASSSFQQQRSPSSFSSSDGISELTLIIDDLNRKIMKISKENEQLKLQLAKKQQEISILQQKYAELEHSKAGQANSDLPSQIMNSSNQTNLSFLDIELNQISHKPQKKVIRKQPQEEIVREEQNGYIPADAFTKIKDKPLQQNFQAQFQKSKLSNVNFDGDQFDIELRVSELNRRVFHSMMKHLQVLPPNKKSMFLQMVSLWSETKLDGFIQCASDLQ